MAIFHCLWCGREFTSTSKTLHRECCSHSCKAQLKTKRSMDSFYADVSKSGPTWNGAPCWEWTGAIAANGYARKTIRGRSQSAHKISWQLANGPVPKGLCIDHLCRNRRCVNPAHLEAVSQGENLKRGDTQAAKNSTKTHCLRGHEFTPENTYLHDGKRNCKACMRIREAGLRKGA